MEINDKSLKALAASLKFREMRNQVINSNIANAETPGYKSMRLDFEKALSRALDVDGQLSMSVQDGQHFNVGGGGFDNLEPELEEDPNGVISENGNTVDPEQEMARLAENKIMYDATIQLINKKIGLKRYMLNADR